MTAAPALTRPQATLPGAPGRPAAQGRPEPTGFVRRHALLVYCAVAFGVTWGGILLLVGPGGLSPTAEHLVLLLGLGYVAMLAGPTLGGLALTALVDGRAGLRALRASLLHWRVGRRWYAALLVAPLTVAGVLLVLSLASPQFVPRLVTEENRAGLVQYSVVSALLVAVFEELGWTGFAVPALRRRHGVLATGLIAGVLHAAWTALIVYLAEQGIQTAGGVPRALYLPVAIFSWQVAYRLLVVWVYDRTGSLLLAMLMVTSLVASWTSLNPPTMSRDALVVFYLLLSGVWGVMAAALAAAGGSRQHGGRGAIPTALPAAAQRATSFDVPGRDGATERATSSTENRVALALSGAVLVVALVPRLMPGGTAYGGVFAPDWIVVAAAVLAGLAAAAGLRGDDPPSLPRRALAWSGFLLMAWASSGLLLDVLRVVGLIPLDVDVPGMVRRALALAASVVLARVTLFRPPDGRSGRVPSWFGWAAFALALPYPLLKTWWAMGGRLGLTGGGVGGELAGSFALWLPSIPFLLAAVLSLLLVPAWPTWRPIPRWLLLTAGWVATATAANVGPAACWALVSALVSARVSGDPVPSPEGMATWVTPLIYGSWLLFAVAIGAATRSYQLRSAAPQPI